VLDIDPVALNADLAGRLRGCALVCEIDINAALHSELIEAMKKLKAHGITEDKDSLRKYAALVTTYLVAEGIFNFADGTFFPNLSVQVPRARLIYVFEFALDIYRGLERFQPLVDAGALRYLAPILAHGGIPQYSLGDFFSVVLDAERRGAIDGRDMIAYWREHPSAFASSDRAVERFLLYGGDISLDFLDRSLDLIRSRPATEGDLPADQFGLPAYVCDAFLALAPNTRCAYHSSGQDGRVGSAVPRPSVIIGPWDAIGPIVVLPPVGGQLRDTSWSVLATDGATRYDGSSTERYASLSPALHWTVEMRDRTGNEVRTFTFPGLARSGALFFDYDDRNLIPDLTRLRGGRVWILRVAGEKGLVQLPSGARLEPVETVPPLTGMWDGYVLNAYDLSKTEKVVIGIAGDTSLWVRIRSDRIALGGESLPGVNTSEGLPVYAEAPELILPGFNAVSQPNGLWFVRVTCDGIEHTFDAEVLKSKDSDPIRSVTPVDRISRVQVMARGPLGMDLRAEFCIVPHLSVQRPERVLLPATKPDQVVSHVLVRAPDSVVRRLDVLGGMDTVAVDVSDVYGKLVNIRIEVPCLQWALVTDTGARTELGQQLIRASVRDVIDGGVSLLIIRTRRAATFIKLQLRHDVRILSEMEGTTAGDDGRWAFDMRGFSDAIRESNEPVLSLLLIIGGYDVTVGSVRAELEATDLTIHQRTGGSEITLTLTWNESRPLRHRVVRLWPLTMPWNRPVSVPVDDEAHGVVTLTKVNEEMPPGCYVAELGIDDGWSTATPEHTLAVRQAISTRNRARRETLDRAAGERRRLFRAC